LRSYRHSGGHCGRRGFQVVRRLTTDEGAAGIQAQRSHGLHQRHRREVRDRAGRELYREQQHVDHGRGSSRLDWPGGRDGDCDSLDGARRVGGLLGVWRADHSRGDRRHAVWIPGLVHGSIGVDLPHDRYYDPTTDQFLSVDPLVAETGQPYAFTGDDPLNATDPLGLLPYDCHTKAQCKAQAANRKKVAKEDEAGDVKGKAHIIDIAGAIKKHWRVIAKVGIAAVGVVTTVAACGTAVLCGAAVAGFSSLTSYLTTSQDRTVAGALEATGEGAITGLIGGSSAEVYGVGLKSATITVGTGGAFGGADYLNSPGSHSLSGLLGSAEEGGALSFPADQYFDDQGQ
jgi:hypothetical protein